MKLTDERLISYVKKRHGENVDLDKFLNPTLNDLFDAQNFKDIEKIVSRINIAIQNKERILVFADFDCDGVCSATILYLYLKSRNAVVDVFIPNRFDNGYGISVDAIEEIIEKFAPNLLITVDLGISAVEEVEILKSEGIDVIITDHHLPQTEIPDTLILDPKYNNEAYGFDSLCGAGVAMKLVEAIGGRNEANKYIDFCAIATVGDIVPLKSENRTIAKIGIANINGGNAHKSLLFMIKKLGISNLTSTDISFKIVPRINACGRIDTAMKVFDFLIETDDDLLEEKYAEIEADNAKRLELIDQSLKEINQKLLSQNLLLPVIIVSGKFHEGILGILASKLCHEYDKPAMVFTVAENGNLKGSGRSTETIDLHKEVLSLVGLTERFGGHKMAVGLEILPDNFDIFKAKLLENMQNIKTEDTAKENNYDFEVTDDDLNLNFIKQIELLEPFGCENEKPIVMLRQNEMQVCPISEKAFKHYKLYTQNNNEITYFYGYYAAELLKSKSEKELMLELETNEFNGKLKPNILLKNIVLKTPDFSNLNQFNISSLYNKYYSIFDFNDYKKYFVTDKLEEVIVQKIKKSGFGTAIIASRDEDFTLIKKLKLEHLIGTRPNKNKSNVILFNFDNNYHVDDFIGYQNIIFLHNL